MRKQHCAGYKHKVRWQPSLFKWPADHIVNCSLLGAFDLKMWFFCCNILAPGIFFADFNWSSLSCRYELRHIWSAFLWVQANVRQYYQQFEEQQTQSLIDQKVKEHLGQTAAALAQQQVGGAVYSHLATLQGQYKPLPTPGLLQRPAGLPTLRPPVLPPPTGPSPGKLSWKSCNIARLNFLSEPLHAGQLYCNNLLCTIKLSSLYIVIRKLIMVAAP